jgi:hypothetical protein
LLSQGKPTIGLDKFLKNFAREGTFLPSRKSPPSFTREAHAKGKIGIFEAKRVGLGGIGRIFGRIGDILGSRILRRFCRSFFGFFPCVDRAVTSGQRAALLD